MLSLNALTGLRAVRSVRKWPTDTANAEECLEPEGIADTTAGMAAITSAVTTASAILWNVATANVTLWNAAITASARTSAVETDSVTPINLTEERRKPLFQKWIQTWIL